MVGPVVSCYVPPGNASGAVCSDVNANYGVSLAATQVSVVEQVSVNGTGWSLRVATPLARLGITASPVSMMFAYTAWNSPTRLPDRHTSTASRTIQSVTVPSVGPPPSTSSSAPLTQSPASSSPSSPTPPGLFAPLTLSLFSGNLVATISYNTVSVYVQMIIAGDLSATIGVASAGMSGSLVSCYGGGGNTANAMCVDIDGSNYNIVPASTISTSLLGVSASSSSSTLSFTTPRSRFPSLAAECRMIFARTPFNILSRLPLKHGTDSSDHVGVMVNFVTGAVSELQTPYDHRATAYGIVGGVGAGLLLLATVVNRFTKVLLAPSHIVLLQLMAMLVIIGMIAVVVVMANRDFEIEPQSQYRAFGEASAFILSMLMVPTTKHIGIGVLLGSSYERMLFLHPLLGFLLLVTSTTHMGGMFAMFASPSDLFLQTKNVFGFITWLCIVAMALPAMFIRRKSYAAFRATHLLFVAVLVFGALHYDGLWPMLIPGAFLWVLDVVLRIASAARTKAQVKDVYHDKQSGVTTLRLSVTWKAPPEPASYAFILVPSISPLMHPFTVARSDEVDSFDKNRRILTFFIKDNGGSTWTAGLAKYATRSMLVDALRVSVFGPHGKLQVPLERCRHVVLVAGGIGITPMISILERISAAVVESELPNIVELTLIWVSRDEALFDLLRASIDGLVGSVMVRTKSNVMLYCTSKSKHGVAANLDEGAADVQLLDVLLMGGSSPPPPRTRDTRIAYTRPDFDAIFAGLDNRDVGCYICGPPLMMASAAQAASLNSFWVHQETFEL